MASGGDRVGPYTLLRLVRTRGPVEVWVAQATTGEHVALSISLLGHKNEEETRRLFDGNLKIAKLVRHPNLAAVLGGGHDEGLRYIASDVPDTFDLARVFEVLRAGESWLAPGTAAHLALSVARALEYIHALTTPEGLPLYLVHRDVAPHSILIDRTGGVKLAEFVGAIETQALVKTAGKEQADQFPYKNVLARIKMVFYSFFQVHSFCGDIIAKLFDIFVLLLHLKGKASA